MEIITPNTYLIKLEEKDHKAIIDCMTLLEEITTTMNRLNCEILTAHYSDIEYYDLKEIIDKLDSLRYAETIKEA